VPGRARRDRARVLPRDGKEATATIERCCRVRCSSDPRRGEAPAVLCERPCLRGLGPEPCITLKNIRDVGLQGNEMLPWLESRVEELALAMLQSMTEPEARIVGTRFHADTAPSSETKPAATNRPPGCRTEPPAAVSAPRPNRFRPSSHNGSGVRQSPRGAADPGPPSGSRRHCDRKRPRSARRAGTPPPAVRSRTAPPGARCPGTSGNHAAGAPASPSPSRPGPKPTGLPLSPAHQRREISPARSLAHAPGTAPPSSC